MSLTHNEESSEALHASHGRRARIALLVLLMMTGGLAAGILFVKFKLETLRAAIEREAVTRIGVSLDGGTVQVNGLRGLRIDEFRATLRAPLGPDIRIAVPRALVDIDLADLLSGRMTVDRVNIDNAEIQVSPGGSGTWFNSTPANGDGMSRAVSFRLTGSNCTLDVPGVAGESRLRLVNLDLDLAKLTGSNDLLANVSGSLEGGSESRIAAKLRFATMADFDLRIGSAALGAADINALVPHSDEFIESGSVLPKLQVNGYPDQNLVLSIEMEFENLALHGQPQGLPPAAGTLTALANLNLRDQALSLATARVASNQISGDLEGSVQLGGPLPEFDLVLNADALPEMAPVEYTLPIPLEEYGALDVQLEEPSAIGLRLQGTPQTPRISVVAQFPGGTFKFSPEDNRFPALDLTLGALSLAWDGEGAAPRGQLDIVNGVLDYADLDVRCENLRGRLRLDETMLRIDPLNGRIGGDPLVAQATYNLIDEKFSFSLNGTLPQSEKTPFPDMIPKADFSGPIGIACKGDWHNGRLTADVSLDATQAWFELDWWFDKPVGTGLGADNLHLEYRPGRSLDLVAEHIRVDTNVARAEVHGVRARGRWRFDTVSVTAPELDIASVGSCLRIPYLISGGKVRDFSFTRELAETGTGDTMRLTGDADAMTIRPKDTALEAEVKVGRFDVVLDRAGDQRTGRIQVNTAMADVPPLNSGWLRNLRPEDEALDAKYPRVQRHWDLDITADTLNMPPWNGSTFVLRGWTDPNSFEITNFGANIEDGRLQGSYRSERAENTARFDATWNGVPAHMLLKYLQLPDLLTGNIAGTVGYSVDRDEPETLRGEGSFVINEGQFSADYLFTKFEKQLEEDFSSLPGSLKFSRFGSKVALEGPLIKTTDLALEADALGITGAGHFVPGGDMDYELKVALPPATAERIPVLASNINVQGYKVAQRNVELGFRVSGPSFSPNAVVTGLPSVGDTVLSGVGEVGREVSEVIDAPRQIIMDLFRIMGGIVKSPGRDGNRENGRVNRSGRN